MSRWLILCALLTEPAFAQQPQQKPSEALIQGVIGEVARQEEQARARALQLAGELSEAKAALKVEQDKLVEVLKKCGDRSEAKKDEKK